MFRGAISRTSEDTGAFGDSAGMLRAVKRWAGAFRFLPLGKRASGSSKSPFKSPASTTPRSASIFPIEGHCWAGGAIVGRRRRRPPVEASARGTMGSVGGRPETRVPALLGEDSSKEARLNVSSASEHLCSPPTPPRLRPRADLGPANRIEPASGTESGLAAVETGGQGRRAPNLHHRGRGRTVCGRAHVEVSPAARSPKSPQLSAREREGARDSAARSSTISVRPLPCRVGDGFSCSELIATKHAIE